MASLTITAVKHNGGAQENTQPGSSQIYMNENVASGTIVGKVTGFAGNPANMNLVVEPANLYANRYELWNGSFVDDDGVTQTGWFIRVKNGGPTLMDYEDENFGYLPDFPEAGGARHNQITFKFYTGAVSSSNLTDQLVFDTILKDIENEGPANAAPHTIRLDNDVTDTVAESLGVGQVVGTLTATDDATPAASITYAFDPNFNGAGHFEIDNATKQIKVKTALNYEDTVTTTQGAGLEQDAIGKFYRLKVIATDNGNPALSSTAQEIKVYVTDVNEAPNAPSYTGTPSVAENANAATVGTIVTVGGSTDPEGLAVTYHLSGTTGANPGNRFVVGTDGKITLAANVTLDYEAADLQTDATGKYYTVKVVAKDPAGNTSTDKDVKIYVTDVNDAPSLSIADASVQEGDDGVTLITFTVTRSGDPSGTADVDWNFGHITTNDSDLVFDPTHPANGTIHFADGEVTQQIVLQVAGDADFELSETFQVMLSNPSTGVTITRATATGTITNDDTNPGNAQPTIMANGPTEFVATNQGPVDAFDNLIIDDQENEQLTLTIEFNSADGELVAVAGSAINIPSPGTGPVKRYEWTNLTEQQVNAILHDLQFDPTDRAAGGAPVTTQFTISVKDVSHPTTPVVNTAVKVTSTPPAPVPNNAPANLQLSNASVLEYDPVGKEVGTFSATDANNDALTYTLLDNAGGRFAISGNKLVLAGPGVNYEDAKSHQIKVQVSDGKGGVIDQVFTINVGDQLTLNKRGTKKADKLNGSALDDILKGGTGNAKDTIKGLAGDDQLFGEGGDDKLFGGDGIDSLFGGKGNDTLKGEAGKDLLKGEVGNDKLYGGLGNDVLYGGKGNDLLKGDADDDVLYGEEGNDKLTGGAGNDTFVFNKKASKANFDTITDFKSGQDKLFLDNAVFKKLGTTGTFDAPAKLDVSMFRTNKAKDKNDYLVYKGGVLYYDANGSAKGGEVEIAKLKGLKVTDIWVI